MKILMISSYLPYPLHSGGHVRLFNLIKELSSKHEITLICESRPHQTEQDRKEVEKICKKVVTVPRLKQWSVKNILKSITSSHSFLITGHTNIKMQEVLNDELKTGQFDIIHVETFYVMQNLLSTSLPVILVEHNIEHQVYQRFVDRMPFFIKPLLSIDIAKIRNEEEVCWKRADRLVAVSNDDKKVMEKTGYSSSLVANGVDLSVFKLKDVNEAFRRKEKKILFIGDFKWLQNRDTAKWIIKDIWPLIREKGKDKREKKELKLWIVGRNIPESIRQLTSDPDIIFDEESSKKSAPEIFREAYLLLSPIRIGGGTSYKILESMASGTPVVTMDMSAQSLSATDRKEILIGGSEGELAQKVIELTEDNMIYKKISTGGRMLIENKYSWKEIAKELDKVYISLKN